MTEHVPDGLLQAFVDGEVGEQLAVHIAEHIDSCPGCSTRATALEPLAAAFAAMEDPVPPSDLAMSVLATLGEPEPLPIKEVGVGVSLLLSAALLTTAFGNPLLDATDVGAILGALGALSRGLSVSFGSFPMVLAAVTVLALVGGLITLRYSGMPGISPNTVRRAP